MATTCALAACGPRDGVYDPSSFHVTQQITPRDVVAPSNAGDGPSDFNGLYLEGTSIDSCCWIAPHAILLVRKRGPAKTLVVGVRVPNFPRFAKGQTVTIAFPGTNAAPQSALVDAGAQRMIEVPVPPSLRASSGLTPVEITSTVDYVPSRDTPPSRSIFTVLHLRAPQTSTDARTLGVLLLYLYYQ
jgi:hypothetical protein